MPIRSFTEALTGQPQQQTHPNEFKKGWLTRTKTGVVSHDNDDLDVNDINFPKIPVIQRSANVVDVDVASNDETRVVSEKTDVGMDDERPLEDNENRPVQDCSSFEEQYNSFKEDGTTGDLSMIGDDGTNPAFVPIKSDKDRQELPRRVTPTDTESKDIGREALDNLTCVVDLPINNPAQFDGATLVHGATRSNATPVDDSLDSFLNGNSNITEAFPPKNTFDITQALSVPVAAHIPAVNQDPNVPVNSNNGLHLDDSVDSNQGSYSKERTNEINQIEQHGHREPPTETGTLCFDKPTAVVDSHMDFEWDPESGLGIAIEPVHLSYLDFESGVLTDTELPVVQPVVPTDDLNVAIEPVLTDDDRKPPARSTDALRRSTRSTIGRLPEYLSYDVLGMATGKRKRDQSQDSDSATDEDSEGSIFVDDNEIDSDSVDSDFPDEVTAHEFYPESAIESVTTFATADPKTVLNNTKPIPPSESDPIPQIEIESVPTDASHTDENPMPPSESASNYTPTQNINLGGNTVDSIVDAPVDMPSSRSTKARRRSKGKSKQGRSAGSADWKSVSTNAKAPVVATFEVKAVPTNAKPPMPIPPSKSAPNLGIQMVSGDTSLWNELVSRGHISFTRLPFSSHDAKTVCKILAQAGLFVDKWRNPHRVGSEFGEWRKVRKILAKSSPILDQLFHKVDNVAKLEALWTTLNSSDASFNGNNGSYHRDNFAPEATHRHIFTYGTSPSGKKFAIKEVGFGAKNRCCLVSIPNGTVLSLDIHGSGADRPKEKRAPLEDSSGRPYLVHYAKDAQGTGTVVFETSPKDGFVGTSVLTSMHSLTMNAPVQDLVPGSGPQFPSQADVGKATGMGGVRWQHSAKHCEYLGYQLFHSAEDVVLAYPGMGLEAKAPESQPPLEHSQVWCSYCRRQIKIVMSGYFDKQKIENHLKSVKHKRNTPLGAHALNAQKKTKSHYTEIIRSKRTKVTTNATNAKRKIILCKVDGCDKQSRGPRCEGMCASHYKEINPEAVAAINAKKKWILCKVDGCDKLSRGPRCEGMCASHFKAT